MSLLTTAQAVAICEAVLAKSRELRMAPICVAVMDASGSLLALQRDEAASSGRPRIAEAKAAGCLAMGFGGRELARRAQAGPTFFASLAAILPGGIVPVPGGVLIRNAQGQVIGAAGVSGDTSDNDEVCLMAGIAAAGLAGDAG